MMCIRMKNTIMMQLRKNSLNNFTVCAELHKMIKEVSVRIFFFSSTVAINGKYNKSQL